MNGWVCVLLQFAEVCTHTTCWKTLVTHCWVPAQASSTRDRWFMFQSLSISQAQAHINREALYKCYKYTDVWLYKRLHYCWITTKPPVFILKSTRNSIQNLFYFLKLMYFLVWKTIQQDMILLSGICWIVKTEHFKPKWSQTWSLFCSWLWRTVHVALTFTRIRFLYSRFYKCVLKPCLKSFSLVNIIFHFHVS